MFPLLSVQVVSACLFCEPSNNQSTSKCVSGCNLSPDGDKSIFNAVLSTHTEHGNGKLLLPGIGGSPGKIFNSCQAQGNSFSFFTHCNSSLSSFSICRDLFVHEQIFEKGYYTHTLLSKTGNSQDVKGHAQSKGRGMPKTCERGHAQRCYKTPVIYYSKGILSVHSNLFSVPINTSLYLGTRTFFNYQILQSLWSFYYTPGNNYFLAVQPNHKKYF